MNHSSSPPDCRVVYETSSAIAAEQFLLHPDAERIVLDCSAGVVEASEGDAAATLPVHTRLAISVNAAADLAALLGRAVPAAGSADAGATGVNSRQVDQRAAAIADLLSRVAQCDSAQNGCEVLADELRTYFTCDRVAVLIDGRSGSIGLCSQTRLDPHGETAATLRTCLKETREQGSTITWQAGAAEPGLLAHRQLAGLFSSEAVISIRLAAGGGGAVAGAILCAGDATVLSRSCCREFLEALAPIAARLLSLLERSEGSWIRRQLRRWNMCRSPGRARLAGGLMAALAALMILPWSYTIDCACEVIPAVRRYVVAPQNGILAAEFAEQGDHVRPGQLLARLDDRELRWQLSSLLASRDQAAKQHDLALAAADVAGSQLAACEKRRLDEQIALAEYRLSRLEVRAPVEGIVIQDAVAGASGAPVRQGETLFQILPPDSLELQVLVPERDIDELQEGLRVAARLDHDSTQTFRGNISRLDTVAQLHRGQNVFAATMPVEVSPAMRPGARGRAKVSKGRRPLAWILFHRAWERMVLWTGW